MSSYPASYHHFRDSITSEPDVPEKERYEPVPSNSTPPLQPSPRSSPSAAGSSSFSRSSTSPRPSPSSGEQHKHVSPRSSRRLSHESSLTYVYVPPEQRPEFPLPDSWITAASSSLPSLRPQRSKVSSGIAETRLGGPPHSWGTSPFVSGPPSSSGTYRSQSTSTVIQSLLSKSRQRSSHHSSRRQPQEPLVQENDGNPFTQPPVSRRSRSPRESWTSIREHCSAPE